MGCRIHNQTGTIGVSQYIDRNSGPLVGLLVHGIVKIEDVTDRARELKRIIDEIAQISDIGSVGMGLLPNERVFIVD